MPIKSKTPVQNLAGVEDLNEVARRYIAENKDRATFNRAKWTAAKRKAYLKAHPENFAGPDGSYPIEDGEDVKDAWGLAGHADSPDAVRSKVKEIARRLGLEGSLPDTAKETAARADQPEDGNDDGDKDGQHSDGEDAMQLYDRLASVHDPDDGDGNEDDTEEGDEDLKPEAVGGRAESDVTIVRDDMPEAVSYYAPITRINKEKREVVGVATAEIKDAYRTVIGYEASKDAFARWRGNIREMHQNKAVGRALEITPDDEHRRIIVRARISKGAQDTWEKVLDGTLTGFSIGGKNGKWTTRVIDGEELPYLDRYDQAELSLVDNPGCPVANFEVVRADGLASDILAKDDEMTTPKSENARTPGGDTDVQRAGARLSKETQDAMHMARDHAKNAMSQTCATCGCDECGDHMAALNSIGKNDDNDGDMDANYMAPASMRRLVADIVREVVAESLREQLAPMTSRVNALLASDAQRSDESPEISRRVDDMTAQLDAIKKLVEEIHSQPADGGPVLHGGGPVDKVLATSAQRSHGGSDAEAIQRAMALGFSPPDDPNDQIRAASKLFKPIPRF